MAKMLLFRIALTFQGFDKLLFVAPYWVERSARRLEYKSHAGGRERTAALLRKLVQALPVKDDVAARYNGLVEYAHHGL